MDPGFMGAPPMGAPPMQPGVGPVELMPMGVPSMMGAPPLMTQMGAAPAPMADLEKLEKKKRDHDERHREKEIAQLTKMMRTGERNSGDNKTCAQILCFWGILNALMWTAPLLGDSWWHKVWQGMGIDELTIDMGLFNLHTKVKCAGSIQTMCEAMIPYTGRPGENGGTWAIKELQEKVCKEVPDGCPIMNRMYYSGFAPLIGFPLAAGFELLSILLIFFYWHTLPRGVVRGMYIFVGALPPLAGAAGLTGWICISPMIQELPRLWALQKGATMVNGQFGLNETFSIPFGWCFALALLVAISSSIRVVISKTLGKHIDEPESHADSNESARLMAEATRSYDAMQSDARPAA